mmetsp:Transcript_51640/g.102820  ORF Transcript_51640/g.102820 Transcript_51640/m.102820 type:complete len:273 (-) Transcript_51640:116-934(-)
MNSAVTALKSARLSARQTVRSLASQEACCRTPKTKATSPSAVPGVESMTSLPCLQEFRRSAVCSPGLSRAKASGLERRRSLSEMLPRTDVAGMDLPPENMLEHEILDLDGVGAREVGESSLATLLCALCALLGLLARNSGGLPAQSAGSRPGPDSRPHLASRLDLASRLPRIKLRIPPPPLVGGPCCPGPDCPAPAPAASCPVASSCCLGTNGEGEGTELRRLEGVDLSWGGAGPSSEGRRSVNGGPGKRAGPSGKLGRTKEGRLPARCGGD